MENQPVNESFQGKMRVRTGINQWQSICVNSNQNKSKVKLLQSKKYQKNKNKILKKILDYKAIKIQNEAELIQHNKMLEKKERKKIQ